MPDKLKIGVVGRRDAVLCYLAAGFAVYEAEDAKRAAEQLGRATDDGCAIIYMTPELFGQISEAVGKYSDMLTPAVIPLPEKGGGVGIAQMKKAVERAVGADIIFRN